MEARFSGEEKETRSSSEDRELVRHGGWELSLLAKSVDFLFLELMGTWKLCLVFASRSAFTKAWGRGMLSQSSVYNVPLAFAVPMVSLSLASTSARATVGSSF